MRPRPAPIAGPTWCPEPERREAADALEPAGELDVLHESDLRVAAQTLEGGAPDEDSLVTRADPRQPRPDIHEPGDQPEDEPRVVEADVEAAVSDHGVGEGALDGSGRSGRQPRVGVEEQQDLARGRIGAPVHLACPSSDARHHPGRRKPGGDRQASVPAAAVRDDHLGAGAFPTELRQYGLEVGGLVENGQDDR